MRNPSVYTASELAAWRTAKQCAPGKWRPSRPLPFYGLRLIRSFRLAWRVLVGRYDALDWEDGAA